MKTTHALLSTAAIGLISGVFLTAGMAVAQEANGEVNTSAMDVPRPTQKRTSSAAPDARGVHLGDCAVLPNVGRPKPRNSYGGIAAGVLDT